MVGSVLDNENVTILSSIANYQCRTNLVIKSALRILRHPVTFIILFECICVLPSAADPMKHVHDAFETVLARAHANIIYISSIYKGPTQSRKKFKGKP